MKNKIYNLQILIDEFKKTQSQMDNNKRIVDLFLIDELQKKYEDIKNYLKEL